MKMRKIMSLALAFVFLFSMLPATAVMANADELNTIILYGDYAFAKDEDGNILIQNADDWNALADAVAHNISCSGLIFKMTADIGTETDPVTRPIGQQTGTNKKTDRKRKNGI